MSQEELNNFVRKTSDELWEAYQKEGALYGPSEDDLVRYLLDTNVYEIREEE